MSRTLLKDWLLDKAKYTCTKQVFFLWTLARPGQGGRVTMGLLGSLSKISNTLKQHTRHTKCERHSGEFSLIALNFFSHGIVPSTINGCCWMLQFWRRKRQTVFVHFVNPVKKQPLSYGIPTVFSVEFVSNTNKINLQTLGRCSSSKNFGVDKFGPS